MIRERIAIGERIGTGTAGMIGIEGTGTAIVIVIAGTETETATAIGIGIVAAKTIGSIDLVEVGLVIGRMAMIGLHLRVGLRPRPIAVQRDVATTTGTTGVVMIKTAETDRSVPTAETTETDGTIAALLLLPANDHQRPPMTIKRRRNDSASSQR